MKIDFSFDGAIDIFEKFIAVNFNEYACPPIKPIDLANLTENFFVIL